MQRKIVTKQKRISLPNKNKDICSFFKNSFWMFHNKLDKYWIDIESRQARDY